jgi:hypothetical protein
MGALGLVIVAGASVAADELDVSAAEQRAEIQTQALLRGDAPPPADVPAAGGGYPARARLADALVLARVAAIEQDKGRRDLLLGRAVDEAYQAAHSRPHWGEAWMVVAFIQSMRGGPTAGATREALARSYADAPFLPDSAAWRVFTGLAAWELLDDYTRRRVSEEAVWVARRSLAGRNAIFAAMRESPAYSSFLIAWRAAASL